MAYSVNWLTKLITIPQTDLLLLSPSIYQLDLEEFHREIRRLEWAFDEGLPWIGILNYNPVVVLGGIPYAAGIEVINGYTVEFENGAYAVNLAGANSNIADVAVVNNVSIRPQNSAGLINLDALLSSAYQGMVVIDPLKGQAGTQTPLGMFSTPSNNVTDALAIAVKQGVNVLMFMRSMAIYEDLSEGYTVKGNTTFTTLTAEVVADLTHCSVENITITGELDGLNIVKHCYLEATTRVNGHIENCGLKTTLEIIGNTIIERSYSMVEGHGYPVVSVLAGNLIVRDYHGSIGLANMTSGVHSVGVDGEGRVVIEASCTGGDIHIRGNPYDVVDNSGPGCSVSIETDSHKATEILALVTSIKDFEEGRWAIDSVNNQMVYYKGDNTSEIARYDLKDISGNPAHENVYERVKV